ncbi:expressed protein [Chlorella variabilis]|uniref:Expressed protein n=1 Tax=Chlorella variabilis TaxID=554065 RepID=E1Z7U8_CHLVA|nr:expressed protein [Chlorella variabilis]EFN57980.1 expressed protein [Chlorella variabilis]|eukprot:XP_005850082.1 expressed protein [Chlorella variabilis]
MGVWVRALLALALLLALLGGHAEAKLQAKPIFLTYSSFSPHPKSWQYWWQDDLKTGKVRETGRSIIESCFPYNQIIPRKGKLKLSAVQHNNPTALIDLSLRLYRPDLKFITGIQINPACKKKNLLDAGLSYGPVGCKNDIFRLAMSPKNCTDLGGTVTAIDTRRPSGNLLYPNLDCTWVEDVPYDMTKVVGGRAIVPASGSVMYEVLANYHQWRDDWPFGFIDPPAAKERTLQILGFMPVSLEDEPGKACKAPYCGWSLEQQTTLEMKSWSDDTQFTVVAMSPILLIPIGGNWRLKLKASRIREPPNSRTPGYEVSRYLITFDDDLLKARRQLGSSRAALCIIMATLSTYIEVVPPCPKKPKVPFATFVDTESQGYFTATELAKGKKVDDASSLQHSWPWGIPRTSFVLESFDLSFLSPKAQLTFGSLFMLVSSAFDETAKSSQKFTVEVYDGAKKHSTGAPCMPPVCPGAIKLGSGSFKGTRFKTKADRMQYLELKLSPDKIAKYAGSKERLQLALMIPALNKDRIDGLRFRAGDSGSPPFLVLKASCKA